MRCRKIAGVRNASRNHCRKEAGFTLVEILTTSGVLIVVGATAMYALTFINRYASSTRVQAAAQSIVQNQIDQVLSRGPYVPQNTPPDIPTVLVAGTTVSNNLPVFIDPDTGAALVTGTLTTTVQDTGAKYTNTPLYVLQVSVTLNYTFRGKAFTVVMDTLRGPDQ